MPRQLTTYQFDLFSKPLDATTVQRPQWQTLPAEARRSVTKLMVSLILDHVDGEHAASSTGEKREKVSTIVSIRSFRPVAN